jgi:hypothetical protein
MAATVIGAGFENTPNASLIGTSPVAAITTNRLSATTSGGYFSHTKRDDRAQHNREDERRFPKSCGANWQFTLAAPRGKTAASVS